MKIALIGGTGQMGEGFARRWKNHHQIIIGSRELQKAQDAAERFGAHAGMTNQDATWHADLVVLTVPFQHLRYTTHVISSELTDQIILSVAVPIQKFGNSFDYSKSAPETIKQCLPEGVKIVSAFQNVPAAKLADPTLELDYDVIVCGDDQDAKKVVFDLVKLIKNLRPLDGGPLSNSYLVEGLTSLLLNIAKHNNLHDLGVRFL